MHALVGRPRGPTIHQARIQSGSSLVRSSGFLFLWFSCFCDLHITRSGCLRGHPSKENPCVLFGREESAQLLQEPSHGTREKTPPLLKEVAKVLRCPQLWIRRNEMGDPNILRNVLQVLPGRLVTYVIICP